MKIVLIILVICSLVYVGVLYTRSDYNSEAVSREALTKINEYRTEAGFGTLIWDDELETLATAHSQWMNDTGDFEHSGFPGENILRGVGSFPNGYSIVVEWLGSPLHKLNLMREDIQCGAVGVVGNYATFMAR